MADQALSIVSGLPLDQEEGLGELTLTGWFRSVCTAGGAAEALVYHAGGLGTGARIAWSYDRLWAEANGVARALLACGVGKGTRVGILMTNRPEFLAAAFGIALAGGVVTTFSTFSTPTELDHLIAASAVSVLLVEARILKRDFAGTLRELDPALADGTPGAIASTRFPFLTHVAAVGPTEADGAIEGWEQFLARGEGIAPARVEARAAGVLPADPGVLFFSSGTTARPKGILSAHRGVTLQLWRWARWYQAGPGDVRVWSANGFFWSGNFAMALGGGLTSGGCLVLQSTFNAEEALALVEHERATMILAWPHQWQQLVAAPNWASADLSSLTYIDCRSPIAQHPTVRSTWREPSAAFGNTETFTLMTAYPANTPDEVIAGSHGLPCPGNTLKIVDPLSGVVVPLGERGEIAVKGPTLMLGYIGVPLADTLDAEGYFRTGDAGHLDATGRLYWHGRLNDIIKTGGANVSPVEIDAVLKTIPGIKAVQTVGVPHDTLGELVVACVVPHAGATLDEATIQRTARETLASFKVPRRVLFFSDADIALTGSAKIKTADLRKLATERLEQEQRESTP
ncbi:class I adenylate-forming enzyme family protein [Novosphingobium piscinae]|uniref:Acyl--CoA ligase n=1 Tax=Novosphingobium piscinae TaxID=1507448 RepID=A0A7X1FWP6_9SPHN|nr:class I adenylate-forming enzyme family protein [Novosphingobium piscinae]MBC2667727.1 acyl--CoA ligase [Novosphingobium piscinae]